MFSFIISYTMVTYLFSIVYVQVKARERNNLYLQSVTTDINIIFTFKNDEPSYLHTFGKSYNLKQKTHKTLHYLWTAYKSKLGDETPLCEPSIKRLADSKLSEFYFQNLKTRREVDGCRTVSAAGMEEERFLKVAPTVLTQGFRNASECRHMIYFD